MVKFGESNFLRPKYDKASYKNEDAYLRAVYRKNKNIRMEGFTFKMFKENIKNIKLEEGYKRIDSAIESFGRTRTFMSLEEIHLSEVKKTISKGELKKLMRQTGETTTEYYQSKNGKMRKRQVINWDEFKWNSAEQRFESANGKIGIRFLYPDNTEEEPWWEAFVI